VKRIQAHLPGAYVVEVAPSPAIDGISKPTKVVTFDMVLSTHISVPEQVVYEVAKVLHENKAALAAIFPPFNLFVPEHMAKPVEGVDFHPGALKFYREIGLVPKS
jgi:TRAP-type uncharacterized transport system substrate-binding protein